MGRKSKLTDKDLKRKSARLVRRLLRFPEEPKCISSFFFKTKSAIDEYPCKTYIRVFDNGCINIEQLMLMKERRKTSDFTKIVYSRPGLYLLSQRSAFKYSTLSLIHRAVVQHLREKKIPIENIL